jgi:DNA-binding response OmpR family regulator
MYTVESLFFPTKIILIDDDQDFLLSVSRHINKFFQVETFNDPHKAYDYILKNQQQLEVLNPSAFTFEEDEDSGEISLDSAKIHSFARNTEKNNFSVVVISDHDMPGMNGIQLFEKLSKTSVMKILLTGKADLKLTIDAFNRGFVDKFLIKDTDKMLDEIIMNVRACQRTFFSKISYPILTSLNIPIDSLLNKNEFSFNLMDFVQNNDFSEFYLIDTIGSFLVKRKTGNLKYFICMLERQFDDYLRFASASRASSRVLDGLSKRTHAPVFASEEDRNLPAKDWEKILHPFEKKDGYYFCFIER